MRGRGGRATGREGGPARARGPLAPPCAALPPPLVRTRATAQPAATRRNRTAIRRLIAARRLRAADRPREYPCAVDHEPADRVRTLLLRGDNLLKKGQLDRAAQAF